MIYVGIDVAKDKHDCVILDSDGCCLATGFTIPNNRDGFEKLLQCIKACNNNSDETKIGLEATGHYSYNILGFLLESGLTTYLINPLYTNSYRKYLSLRKTKTDRIDARTIATMLISGINQKPYTDIAYHNEELKSLTRYRFKKVEERAKLKQSVSRLVNILFPELEQLISTIHLASVYALLSEFPSAQQIAGSHLTRLTHLLHNVSKGRYGKDKATEIREAAKRSIGTNMPVRSLELRHTIHLIQELDKEIVEIEAAIKEIMDSIKSPITTIPGMGYRMGAAILAEVGDFSKFDSPNKLLAYAGLSPSIHDSGKSSHAGPYSHMEKRGSRYLRYAIFNAAKFVCKWEPKFSEYLAKKRAEGKHYNVAISHAAKKLIRVIYALHKSKKPYGAAV